MIDAIIALCAFTGGFAAHQTDRLVSQFPRDWELLSRYIIGTITLFLFFVAFLRRLRVGAIRDGVAAYAMSAWFVGLGVGAGRLLDDWLRQH